jgi:peptide/nickel transport system substrate-binding protein
MARRISRRTAIAGIGAAGAAAIAACAAPPAPTATPAPVAKPAEPAKPAEAPKPAEAAKPADAAKPAAAAPATGPGILRPTDGTPKRGGILKAAFGVTTSNFDMNQGAAGHVLWQMYNNLVRWNPIDGVNTIVPDLAEGWEKSADGKSYTFKLRQGVKYHDGTAFSSADVVASINRIKNPTEGTISSGKSLFAAVDKVEAPDANTVAFTLSKPVPYFLEALAGGSAVIYSKKAIDENKGDFRKVIAPGTGAFKVKEHRTGERWLLEKNADYWDKELPYLDGIEMIHAAAWSDRGTAVLTGQADMSWNVSIETWQEGEKKPNDIKVARFPSTGAYVLWMNAAKKPLDDPRVRRALNLAISRQDLYVAFQTQEPMKITRYQPAASPLAMTPDDVAKLPGYRKDKAEDLAEAQKLLKEAGVAAGAPLEIVCANVAPHAELLAPAVKGMLDKLGFQTKIRTVERSILQTDERQRGQFDIMLDTSGFPTVDPVTGWLLYFKSGGSQNFYKYSNAEVDKLIDQLEVELDDAKRKSMAKQVEDLLDKEGPQITIGFTDHLPMWKANVKGLSLEKRRFSEWGRFDVAWLDK